MSNEKKLSIPHPDPAWDYYIAWYSLHHIKDKIDEALIIMNENEKSTPQIDHLIKQSLAPASDKLIEIVERLPD
ncbi:MAG: hypothetical protein V7L27_19375 [Nostoc sp.]|uniref:hypothetical protein n=1 Tax=Nostoc sp. TaxID=1180 RepID=UPI002FFCDEEC